MILILFTARNYKPWTDGLFSNLGEYHEMTMRAQQAKNIGNVDEVCVPQKRLKLR